MSIEIKKPQEKILVFLYYEGQLDPNYLTVNKIRDETELTDPDVQDGLRILHENGCVECNFQDRGPCIIEARITSKGVEKAVSLLSS